MLNKIPLRNVASLCVVSVFLSFVLEISPRLTLIKNDPIVYVDGQPDSLDTNTVEHISSIYDKYLQLGDTSLTYEAFYNGLIGYLKLKQEGVILRDSILTIVDFTQHSSKERMYIINTNSFKLLRRSLCAHGKNSGEAMAKHFSNVSGSLQSSLGFYLTAETYKGKFDYALRLDGLEESNSKARERGIVIHGADYATPEFVKKNKGVLGRSFGCPALPKNEAAEIIDLIKQGSCFFIYSNDFNYIESSRLIQSEDLNG